MCYTQALHGRDTSISQGARYSVRMGRISNDGTMQTAHFNKESHRPRYRHLYTCTYTPAPVHLYIMASHAPVHALLRIFTTCTLAHAHLSSNQHLVTTQPKLEKTSLEPNQSNHALAHLRIQSRSQIRHAMQFINSSCHAIHQFIMPCNSSIHHAMQVHSAYKICAHVHWPRTDTQ